MVKAEITQEEKPRARILAEYLAHGYVIGDATLQRAIELDSKHGVSSRFFTTLQGFDSKLHATDRAKATDQTYGITQDLELHSMIHALTGSHLDKLTKTEAHMVAAGWTHRLMQCNQSAGFPI